MKKKVLVLAYYELDIDDLDKLLPLYQKALEMRKKGKINHPKMVSDNYTISGTNRGFRIFEVSDPIQIENLRYYYGSLMKWTITPIIKAEDSIKAYQDSKK